MGSVLISSEQFDRILPELPKGCTMTLYEYSDDWQCVARNSEDYVTIGMGWSPHAAVADAISKIRV